ncbi:MAG: adenylyltransferase/cytidyltransferase family protein [Ruminococcus sp.]
MNADSRGFKGKYDEKVITYGTFDLFHEGHYNILKRAKALGDYLIVGVTSESYDIERGKLNVRDSLLKRIENVRRTGFADEIIIEEYQGQKLSDIIKYKVDLLVLGSDWRGKFDYLKNYCDVVYLERTKNISSTKLRGEGTTYTVGVVTDNDQDNGIVWETKYVSGLHVECVFLRMQRQRSRFVTNMNWIPTTAWRQIMGNGSRDLTAFCPR